MKTKILYVCLILLIFSCKSDQNPLETEIQNLEAELKNAPDKNKSNSLANKYLEFYKEYPDQKTKAEDYLRKGAFQAITDKNYPLAVGFYQTLLREFYSDKSKEDAVDLVAVFQKIGKPETSNFLKQIFTEAFPNHPKSAEFSSSLPADSPSVDSLLPQLGLSMFNTETNLLIEPNAAKYVDACEALALINPDHPEAPEYLYKAAETAKAMRSVSKALTLYDWIIKRYPKYEKAPMALFLKAFTFDNDLKEYEKAKSYYNEFLATYPDHPFAEQTTFLLKHIGKSAEEILQEINPGEK